MRGVGGPLLSIGDLLSDIGDSVSDSDLNSLSSLSSKPTQSSHAVDLPKLFQETYKDLNEALAGSDHSWTALTLKLCSAVETANELVRSANSNAGELSDRVGELEEVVKRGDKAVSVARGLVSSLAQKER